MLKNRNVKGANACKRTASVSYNVLFWTLHKIQWSLTLYVSVSLDLITHKTRMFRSLFSEWVNKKSFLYSFQVFEHFPQFLPTVRDFLAIIDAIVPYLRPKNSILRRQTLFHSVGHSYNMLRMCKSTIHFPQFWHKYAFSPSVDWTIDCRNV